MNSRLGDLSLSEEMVRTILHHVHDAVLLHEIDGSIIYVNETMLEMYQVTAEEALGLSIAEDLSSQENSQERLHPIWQKVVSGENQLFEWKARRPHDNSVFDVEVFLTRVHLASREIILATLRDITARKQTEQLQLERAHLAAFGAEIGTVLAEGDSLQSALHQCTEVMVKHLGVALARIWMLNEKENVLELMSSAGLYTHLDGPHSRIPVGQLKIGLIAKERKPHLTNQVIGDPRISDPEWAKREGMVAFAGYPLLVENRLVGVMAMFSRSPLTQAALQALGSVADRIALAVEHRRTEDALQSSKAFSETILNSMHDAISIIELKDFKIVGLNKAFAESVGMSTKDILGKTCYQVTHLRETRCAAPDDPCPAAETMKSGRPTTFEHMHPNRDGTMAFVEVSASPVTNSKGEMIQVVHVVRNITERKRVENALRESQDELRALAGRLISAKEEENRRLARELHDAFSQRLALLAMEVAALQNDLDSPPGDSDASLKRMGTEIERLAIDVHQMSRQLHPSIVEDLGLTAALRAECNAFSRQHGIPTEFSSGALPDSLPAEISLSLYRIAQESLWNIAKHAQAREVQLAISRLDGEIVLEVQDDGSGFDLKEIKGKGGLGLVSMEERARLVSGRLCVESKPGGGTRVEARIPFLLDGED